MLHSHIVLVCLSLQLAINSVVSKNNIILQRPVEGIDGLPISVPIPQSTEEPEPVCTKGNGYDFDGRACEMRGDPHFTTFRGAYHDSMGQPGVVNPSGGFKDSFYAVAKCNGVSADDLPFQVLTTHFYGNKKRTATAVDYVTLELDDDDDAKFFLFFSRDFRCYANAATEGVSASYDETLKNAGESALTCVTIGDEANIGTRFVASFKPGKVLQSSTDLELTVDGSNALKIHLRGATVKKLSEIKTPYPERPHRVHYVSITVANKFKCFVCGLCGSFKGTFKSQQIELCNGKVIPVKDGARVPSALDINALSYEYNFFQKCLPKTESYKPDLGKIVIAKLKKGCTPVRKLFIKAKCLKAVKAAGVAQCCKTIKKAQCKRLVAQCTFDACSMANNAKEIEQITKEDITQTLLEICPRSTGYAAMAVQENAEDEQDFEDDAEAAEENENDAPEAAQEEENEGDAVEDVQGNDNNGYYQDYNENDGFYQDEGDDNEQGDYDEDDDNEENDGNDEDNGEDNYEAFYNDDDDDNEPNAPKEPTPVKVAPKANPKVNSKPKVSPKPAEPSVPVHHVQRPAHSSHTTKHSWFNMSSRHIVMVVVACVALITAISALLCWTRCFHAATFAATNTTSYNAVKVTAATDADSDDEHQIII